jgi:hypothetical protein
VENGQVYSIFHTNDTTNDDTDYPTGGTEKFFHPHDAKVYLPREYVGHVMIFRTFGHVSYGLIMDGIRPVHISDRLFDRTIAAADGDTLRGPGRNEQKMARSRHFAMDGARKWSIFTAMVGRAACREMQEHFPAGALMARHPENEGRSRLNRQGENAGAIFGFRVT